MRGQRTAAFRVEVPAHGNGDHELYVGARVHRWAKAADGERREVGRVVVVDVGPAVRPGTPRCAQDYSCYAQWYTGREEGEQDLYESGTPGGKRGSKIGMSPGSRHRAGVLGADKDEEVASVRDD